MCGRYNIHDDPWLQTLLSELGIHLPVPTKVNIAPTEAVPVVYEEEGERHMHEMRWWLVPSWAPSINASYSMFNAKAETLATSKAFRGPLRHHRCILPASSFIEWTQQDGRKQPWLIRPQAAAIAFAGLWDVWEKDGNYLQSCTIITTDAVPGMQHLHRRMPLMLRPQDFDRWLDVDAGTANVGDLLQSRLPQPFVVAPLSTDVNNARNKSVALMTPLGAEQIISNGGDA